MFHYNWCHGQINVGGSDHGLVDGLIPAMRLGDLAGLYEVTDERRMGGSDRAMWDNGIEVALKFVKAVPVDRVPRLQPLPDDAQIDWDHVEIWSYHDPRMLPNQELIEENLYTPHWIDVTVIVIGLGREYVNIPWGRATVPEADEPVPREHQEPASTGDPMRREGGQVDGRPIMELVPEDRDAHEYAKEVNGVVAYGTYFPEGFKRAGHNGNWRSHVHN
jgi:hypothetical protein